MTGVRAEEHLLRAVKDRFEGRLTLSFKEAAELLKLNEKTLRKHVRRGNIRFRQTGLGRSRVRREFALEDIVDFYIGASHRVELSAQGAIVHVRKAGRGTFLEGHVARCAARTAGGHRRKA
jgi:excisionase family DNA binding protein